MALEVRNSQNEATYDGIKSDIFALGHILFITHTSMLLFKKAGDKKFERLQKDPVRHVARIVGNEDTDSDFIGLVAAMCAHNPADRPSLADIRGHPWMTKDVIASIEDVAAHFYSLKPEDLVTIDAAHYKVM